MHAGPVVSHSLRGDAVPAPPTGPGSRGPVPGVTVGGRARKEGSALNSLSRILLRAVVTVGATIGLLAPTSVVHAEPTVSELTQRIEKSSADLEKIVEAYNRLNEEIKTSRATAAALSAKLPQLQQEMDRTRAQVGALAANAYKSGGLGPVRALLEPGAADSLTTRLGTLDQLARDRQRRIADYTATQRRYTEQKTRLDHTLARQTAQAKQLAAGRKKIEADLAKLYDMRKAAYGRATEYDEPTPDKPTRDKPKKPSKPSGGGGYTGNIPAVSGSAGVAVRYAYNAIGKPYVWAADGPGGYDCSGLTLAAWRAAGKSLPHNAAMQWDRVAHISRGSLKPGDLVFYHSLGHVALYVGGGKVIHSPTFGKTVRIASVDMSRPYGYGRVR